MEILEFGDKENKSIILMHGFQCPYQIWNKYIEYYKDKYHIIVPIFEGHNPKKKEDFVSLQQTAKKIEDYYISRYGNDVYAIFAISYGGIIAANIWQNKRLNITKLIFDGSPVTSYPKFLKSYLTNFYLQVTHKSQKRDKKTLIQARNGICPKEYLEDFLNVLDHMSDDNIRKYIEAWNDYKLPSNIDTPDTRVMLGTIYYKSIAGISSMQEMTRTFNDEKICRNLYKFMGENVKEYMPHGVTENEFLERLDPGELEAVQQNIVYSMIRRKTFNNARVLKKWQVIVDATELDEGYQKKNEHYLSRCYNKGEDNEYMKYHRSVLEAKIYFGENLVCSIASETIENSEEYINQSDETVKQDCESKAFVRLAAKIKKKFPRLPIILTADGLYVTKNVLQICKDYHWDYIIRYKEGCASSIAKEYRALPEKENVGSDIEYQNKIMFQEFDVNLIYYREKRIVKGVEKETEFAWITSIEITKSNAKKIVRAGRNRWKIENQGFNRQKHWQGNIEHACSFHERAQKNHYLMEQIADFMKQLYEHFYLEKNKIKKLQKNISSELLASFGRQLTETEDIKAELHSATLN